MSLAELFYRKHPRRPQRSRSDRRERPRRVHFERLEPRLLLSADPVLLPVPMLDPSPTAEPTVVVSPASAGPTTTTGSASTTSTASAPAAPTATATPAPASASGSPYVDPDIPAAQEAVLESGLAGLATWGDTVDELAELAETLPGIKDVPGIGASIGELLDIGDLLDTKLHDVVDGFLTGATSTTETDDLIAALEALPEFQNVSGGLTMAGNFEFSVEFTATRTRNDIPIDLGAGASALGVTVDPPTQASATVDVTATLDFDFKFGVDTTPGLAPSEAFFIKPMSDLVASVTVTATGLGFDLDLGFVDASVTGGSVSLTAQVAATVDDPNMDGVVTLAELQGTPLSSLLTLDPGPDTGALAVTLPVDVSVGAFGGMGAEGQLNLTDANLFDGTAPAFSITQNDGVTPAEDVLNFTNLQPSDVLGLLDQLGEALQHMSSTLGVDIPFVGDQLAQVASFTDTLAAFADPLFEVVLTASSSAQANLSGAATFEVSIDGGAPSMVSVTDNNRTTLTDLLADVNAALPAGLDARLVGDQIELFATSPTTRQFQVLNVGAGSAAEAQLGLQNNQLSDLVFEFQTIQELNGVIPADIAPNYDAATNQLRFELDFTRMVSKEIELDFSEGFGPLTAQGGATASVSATLGLDLTLFVDLSSVGSDLTPSTDLATLNDGLGIGNEAALTATTAAPANGQVPMGNFQVNVNGTGALAVNLGSTTGDNLLRSQLVADINAALATVAFGAGDLADVLEATLDGDKLRLVAKPGADVKTLEITSPTAALGFTNGQDLDTDLRIRHRNNTTFEVNLDGLDADMNGVETVQELVDRIEAASGSTVDVEIDPDDPTRLRLTDTLTGMTAFSVQAINDSLAAFGLGLAATDFDGDGIIQSAPLHGDTLLGHFSIEEGDGVSASLTVTASDVDLLAALGIFQVGVENGSLTISVNSSISIVAPGPGTLLGIDEILGTPVADLDTLVTVNALSVPTFTGMFPIVVSGFDFGIDPMDPPRIDMALGTANDLSTVMFTPNTAFTDLLASLADFDTDDIVGLILNVLSFLQNSNIEALNEPLPLINQSINELLGFVDDLTEAAGGLLSGLDGAALESAIASLDAQITALTSDLDLTQKNRLMAVSDALKDALAAVQAGITDLGDGFGVLQDVVDAFRDLQGAISALDADPDFSSAEITALKSVLDDVGASAALLSLGQQVDALILTVLPASVSEADKSELFHLRDRIVNALDDVVNAPENAMKSATDLAGLLAGQLVGLVGALRDAIGDLGLSGADQTTVETFIADNVLPYLLSVEALGKRLAQLLHLPMGSGITIEILDIDPNHDPMDTVVDRAVVVRLDLAVSKMITQGLDFELSGAGPLQVETGGDLMLTLGGSLDLDFAISLTDGDVFLLDSSEFMLTADLTVTDFTASVKFGGVGVELGNPGTVKLRNAADSGPGALTIGITDTADTDDAGAIPIGSVIPGSLDEATVDAVLSAMIGLEVASASIGTLDLSLDLETGVLTDNSMIDLTALLTGPFDFEVLLAGIETFLTFLQTGLQSDIVGSVPIVGDELNAVGDVIQDFRDGFLTPLQNAIASAPSNLEELEDAAQEALFDSIGPGGSGILKLDHTQTSTGFTQNGDGMNTAFDPMATPETGGSYVVTVDGVEQVQGTDYTVDGMGVVNFTSAPASGAKVVIEFLDFQDVDFDIDDAMGEAVLNLHLMDEVTASSPMFDVGLGGFLLAGSVTGGVDVTLGYDVRFGVGLSKSAGFFVQLPEDDMATTDVDESHEAELSLEVDLTDGSMIQAQLFFLQLTAEKNGDTGFSGTLTVDLEDPSGSDNRVFLSELTNFFGLLGDETGIDGEADVHLHLTLGTTAGDTLPTIEADLVVEWDFMIGGAGDAADGLDGEHPRVELNDITLFFGTFLGEAIGPALEFLDDFLAPIRPILEILDTEIPVVSQVAQLFGGDPITFVDAIGLFGDGGDTIQTFLEILIAIDDFITAFDSVGGNVGINFGDLTFDNPDLRNPGEAIDALTNNPAGVLADTFGNIGDVLGQLGSQGAGGTQASSLLQSLRDDLGISFPIFEDPTLLLRAIFGDDEPLVLVTWDIPKAEAGFEVHLGPFGPLLPPVPLFLVIEIGATFFADFSLGFDTRGIFDTGNFIDGLFFGDFTDVYQGSETPELGLTVNASAIAELNVVVAQAGVEGGVRADVTADWHDEASPGKVYLDEVLANLARGIECIFDLAGALTAFLEAFVKIGFDTPFGFVTLFEDSFTLAEVTLLDFSLSCPPLPPPVLAHVSSDTEETDLGVPDQTLILNVGKFADQRQPGYSSDVAEILLIRGESDLNMDGVIIATEDLNQDGQISEDELGEDLDGDGMIETHVVGLLGFGVFNVFSNVEHIWGDAGLEDDEIIADPSVGRSLLGMTVVSDAHPIQVTLFGGPGADELQGGSGGDHLEGGGGMIAGDDLEDQITGGLGDDVILGQAGDDVLFGQGGGDTISGGAGNDSIYGGSNDGQDEGDAGDVITGDGGDDNIRAHLGNDTVEGNAGNDQIRGGLGNDQLAGGTEQDLIEGGAGADRIRGDEGDDLLFGEGADVKPGQGGNDTVFGGGGSDTIKDVEPNENDPAGDGTGNDLFFGDGGQDAVFGAVPFGIQAADLIVGGVGNDTMFGTGGQDTLEGGAGLDYMEGGAGNDELRGGADDDDMIGGANNLDATRGGVTLPGLTGFLDGSDLVIGGDGDDVMLGDNGRIALNRDVETSPDGGAGSDTVRGGDGDDVLFGGGLGDVLTGDGLSGLGAFLSTPGNDIVVGDQGTRNATTIVALHSTVPGSGGDDTISGSGGVDTLLGGDGDDSIAGDADVDYLVGDNGKVTLDAATGAVLRVETQEEAFGGDDTITGGTAADVALGGTGDDIVTGGSDDAADILLGDNGVVNFDFAVMGEIGDEFDIFSTDPTLGGEDTVSGGGGNDTIVGGSGGNDLAVEMGGVCVGGGDLLFGNAGHDVLIGDNAHIHRDDVTAAVEEIETIFPSQGGNDEIHGNAGDDTALGGYGEDTITGDADDDVLLGDNGRLDYLVDAPNFDLDLIETTDPADGCTDHIFGNDGNDVALGGTEGDEIDGGAGFDVLLGDHGQVRLGVLTGSPLIRQLAGATLYQLVNGFPTGPANVTGTFQAHPDEDPDALAAFRPDITLFDFDGLNPTATFGNDTMAGGAGDDVMFGQIGNDLMQGDSSTAETIGFTAPSTVDPSAENAATDGDDYMEGNAGADLMFGDLGQDDMIGGSSDLFGLTGASTQTTGRRQGDGSDTIFGGAGLHIARNDAGDASADGHAADSDAILGDNGRFFRIVGLDVEFRTYNYDTYSMSERIRVRAMDLLDYTPGGSDFNAAGAANDVGAADHVHGESGDDFIHGQVGGDVLFGDGQNDVMIGGYGADWISGGTGDDGILGDDGFLFASRNSSAFGEPLHGIAAIPATEINRFIITSDRVNSAILNVDGALKYTADLTPDNLDPSATPNVLFRPLFANDIVYGGLGHDSIHTGAGDDAISGAEAPVLAYTNNYDQSGTLISAAPIESDYSHPVNPGNVLGYNPTTTKFALYDANDSRRKILLTATGGLDKTGTGLEWLLNHDQTEGPVDTFWIQGQSTYPGVPTDGDDRLFADLGHDWLVGGTGRDSMYSGWGDDLLNADDNINTNAGLNTSADTNPSYEDLAFGGAGRDVLSLNTNGDRGADWLGEFNTFFTPYAQFGAVSVSRLLRPDQPQYFYDVSKSQGADQSLAAQYGSSPARNGEPLGELGLVTSADDEWQDQSGPPRDPQAGNTHGGKVDVKNNPGTAGTKAIFETAEGPAPTGDGTVGLLTGSQLAPIVAEAKALWAEALGAEDGRLAALDAVAVEVGNLPQDRLGVTIGGRILIDSDAAGWGWFVDPTASENGEFAGHAHGDELVAASASPAFGRMDLLTTVMHELGHVIGLGHDADPHDLMGETLAAGERHVGVDGNHHGQTLPPASVWADTRAVTPARPGEAPLPPVNPVVEPSGVAAASSAEMPLGPAENAASHRHAVWYGPPGEVRPSLVDWTRQYDGQPNPYAELVALSGPGPGRLIDWTGRSGATTPVFDPGAGLIPSFGAPDAGWRPAREAAAEREPAADDGAPRLVLLLEPADPGERRRGS